MKRKSSPFACWFYAVAIAVFLVFICKAFYVETHGQYVFGLACLAAFLGAIRLGQLLAGLRGAVVGGLGMLLFLLSLMPALNAAREAHRVAMFF